MPECVHVTSCSYTNYPKYSIRFYSTDRSPSALFRGYHSQSKKIHERLVHIANEVKRKDYDVVAFQEVGAC